MKTQPGITSVRPYLRLRLRQRVAYCTTFASAIFAPRFAVSLLLALMVALCSPTVLAQAKVVTSIKPLQMIASAITDGISEPEVLIPSDQSYHHFTLRPSMLRTLRQADLFVWVGPELETYLSDAVVQASAYGRQLQVLSLPELQVHHAGLDGEDSREVLIPDEGLHVGHKHKQSDTIDPHVWLNTDNARLIAQAMVAALTELDPANASAYTANLAQFNQRLVALEQGIDAQSLLPADSQYAVYHNAFQYFERQFGLQHELVFVASEELQPGVRHMMTVRRAVENTPLNCLMEDVTTQAATVETLLGDKQLRRIRVDTVGQNLSAGPMAYIHLMDNLADAFRQCGAR
jgi:zinc transport system substrate-binding protein